MNRYEKFFNGLFKTKRGVNEVHSRDFNIQFVLPLYEIPGVPASPFAFLLKADYTRHESTVWSAL